MPRQEADIQGGMFNSFQRLIDIAMETRDLEVQQTNLLNFIANKDNSGKSPDSTSPIVTAVPTAQSQVQAINNTTVNIDPVINELYNQTSVLEQIANNTASRDSADISDTSPGEAALKDAGGAKNHKELTKGVASVLLIAGAVMAIGLAVYTFKDVFNIKLTDFLMVAAGLSILFLSISQVAKGEMDIKKAITTLLLIGGTMTMLGAAMGLVGDIDTQNMIVFMALTSLIIASMAGLGKTDISLLDIIMFDAFSSTFVKSIVNSSIIMQDMTVIGDEKLKSFMALVGTILPAYGMLAYVESNLSFMASMNLLLYGFTFPAIAKALVGTAIEVDKFPSDFKTSSLTGLLGMSIALYPIMKSAMNLFEAITPMTRMSGLDSLMRRSSFTKGGGFQVAGPGGAQSMYLQTLFSLGASFAMLPISAMAMLAIAWMFSSYVKMGGKFVAPPIKWSVSIGIAMLFFAKSISQIMYAVEPGLIRNISKESSGGTKFSESKITKSNVPGSLAILGALAFTMVTTAYIMSLFPKKAEKTTPDQKWVINVGMGLLLFSMALGRITKAMKGDNSNFTMDKTSKDKTKSMGLNLNLGMATGMLYMVSMAFSMVLVGHILRMFPSNPVSPPLKWTLSVGLSMLIFAKAYHAIATVNTKSAGFMGKLKGDSSEKSSSGMRAFGGLIFLNLMAISMVSVAGILQFFPTNAKSPDLGWTLKTGIAMILFSKAAASLFAISNKIKVRGRGNIINTGGGSGKYMSQALGGFTFLISIATAIVATAWIFQLLPNSYKSPDMAWILKSGVALMAFTFPIVMIMKANGNKALRKDAERGVKKGKNVGALAQIILVATAIVTTAWILQALPSEGSLKAPTLQWTIQAGVALVAFTMGLVMINRKFKGVKPSRFLHLTGAILLTATAIVMTAIIFQALPSNQKAPELMWTINTGLSILLFGAVLMGIRKLKISNKEIHRASFTLIKIATTLVVMSWIFQMLPSNQKAPDIITTIMIAGTMLILGGSLALLGVMNKKNAILKGAGTIKFILIAAIGISLVMLAVGKSNTTFSQLAIFSAFLGVTIVLAMALGFLGKISKRVKRGANVLMSIAKPIGVLAIAMLIWSAAGVKIKDILLLIATVGALALIGLLIGTKKSSKRIKRGLWVMTLMAVPLAALGFSMLLWKLVNPDPKSTLIQLFLITAVVGVFGFIGYIMGKNAKQIALGLLVMTLTALPIIALSYAFGKWTETFPDPDKATKQLVMFGLTMTILAGAFAIIGIPVVAGMIAIGAGAMILIAGALWTLGKGLESISGGMGDLIKSNLFDDSGETNMLGLKMTNFERAMGGIARSFAIDPITTALMYIGAPAFIMAGIALNTIGESMKTFQGLDLDVMYLAGTLIPNTLGAITTAFADIGKKNAQEGFIKGLFIRGPVADGINSIKGAGAVLSEITTGLVSFANMQFTDVNGKLVTLDSGKLRNVTDNIIHVLDTVSDAFSIVGLRNKKDYGFKANDNLLVKGGKAVFTELFTRGPVADGVKSAKGMGMILSEIASGLVSFASMQFELPDGTVIDLKGSMLTATTDNIVHVMSVLSDAFATVGKKNTKDYGFKANDSLLMKGGKALFTELFTKGHVAEGVKATRGMGLILSQVAEGLVKFASMQFTQADGTIIDLNGNKLKTVGKNVIMVMTFLGKIFADIGEGYNTGGFMGFFGANQVERGVDAVKGVGQELTNIVNAVKGIADFTFTDIDGNKTVIDNKMLKLIGQRAFSMVTVISSVFASIGKNYEEDTSFFPGNLVAKGVEAVKGVGEELVNIITAVKNIADMGDFNVKDLSNKITIMVGNLPLGFLRAHALIGDVDMSDTMQTLTEIAKVIPSSLTALKQTDEITLEQIALYEQTVPRIISIIPSAVVEAITKVNEKVGDPKEAFKLITESTRTIADAIDKIAGYEEPIEKIANNFKTIAASMLDMKDSINTMDIIKLDKANTFFSTIRDIAMPSGEMTTQDVVGEVARGIREEVSKSLEKTDKLVDRLEEIKKQNASLEAKVSDAQSGGGGGASAEFMLTRFESLEGTIEELNKTMGLVQKAFAFTMNVKVMNPEDIKD